MNVHEIAYHRNGVAGAPFHAIIFETDPGDDHDAEGRYLGIVFEAPQHCAVINLDLIAEHGVTFGLNSCRGDIYNAELRAAIENYHAELSASLNVQS